MKVTTRNVVFLSIIFISTFYVYISRNSVLSHLQEFCEWVDSLGYIGFFVLGLADLVGVAICFPFTIVFEFAAGFLYRFKYGLPLILIAKTCGASLGFFLGRTLLKDWVTKKLSESTIFSEVYKEMNAETFRLAVLLRLSPIPSWVNNYGLAITPISFKEYCLATFLAGIPFVAQNVYLGSLMNSLAMENHETPEKIWIKRITLCIAFLASAIVSKYIFKYVSLILRDKSTYKNKI